MSFLAYVSPFLGAVALEAVHWYELRERLHQVKYKKLLRSLYYWIPTIAMIVVGGGVVLVWNTSQSEPQSPLTLLVAGAAAPSLLKKLVAAFLAKEHTVLGAEAKDSPAFRDYFIPA